MHQVVSKDSVLSAVGFVAHHNDVVIRIDWCGLRIVELLNKREDKRRIALQLQLQILTATGNELLGFHIAQQTTVLKSVANLLIKFVTIRQYKECGRTFELPEYLL